MVSAVMRSRLLLVALQFAVVLFTIIVRIKPFDWLDWLCFGTDSVGPCACKKLDTDGDVHDCWNNQMVYRSEFMGFLIFLLIAVLAAAGCAKMAQSPGLLGGLFCVYVMGLIIFVWLPNSIFDVFCDVALCLSSLFLIVQTLLVADWGYMGNDYVMGRAVDARRRNFSSAPEARLKIALVATSAVFFALAVGGTIWLTVSFTRLGWLPWVTLAVSAVLTFVSILEAVKHGNLLTSALVALYETWLTYEVLSSARGDGDAYTSRPVFFVVVGVALALVTLLSAAFHSGLGVVGAIEEPMVEGGEPSAEMSTDFLKQAVVHCCATLFLTTEFAPKASGLGFAFRVVALCLSFLVYAGTLAAPLVAPQRF